MQLSHRCNRLEHIQVPAHVHFRHLCHESDENYDWLQNEMLTFSSCRSCHAKTWRPNQLEGVQPATGLAVQQRGRGLELDVQQVLRLGAQIGCPHNCCRSEKLPRFEQTKRRLNSQCAIELGLLLGRPLLEVELVHFGPLISGIGGKLRVRYKLDCGRKNVWTSKRVGQLCCVCSVPSGVQDRSPHLIPK